MATPTEPMRQEAPYPHVLADLVERTGYRHDEGWSIRLRDMVRDTAADGTPLSRGLTLVILRVGADSYHPERVIAVNHYFPVPPATYDERSWTHWLFDRVHDVELHELMESFLVDGKPAFPPAHGPGNSPYMMLDYGSDADRRTSFRGTLNPE